MKAMEIRPAQNEELINAAGIYCKSWKQAYRGIIPDDYLESLIPELWRPAFKDPGRTCLTAWANGEAAGVCCFGKGRDESLKDQGEIYSIYVPEEYQGQGTGWQLMEEAMKQLRLSGYSQASLWVLEENKPAICFYEKLGFEPAGAIQQENFEEKHLSELLLKKML